MAAEEIYIVKLGVWLARALGQGASFTADLDTDGLGLLMPESIAADPAVQTAGLALADAGGIISDAANALEAAQESGEESELVIAIAQLAEGLIRLFEALHNMVAAINSLTGSLADATERQAVEDLLALLARRMADYLIISVLELHQPRFTLLLKLLGLIEWENIEADPANPLSQDYVKKTIQLQRLKDLITDPGRHFINTLKWGQGDFDPGEIFRTIIGFYQSDASIEVGEQDGDPFLKRGIFRWRRDSSVSPPGLALDITATFARTIQGRYEANKNWGVGMDSTLGFTGGVIAAIAPPLSISVTPMEGEFTGESKIFVNRNPSASPFDIVGGNSLITLSAEDVSVGAGISAGASTATGVNVSPLIFSELKGLTLKLGSEDADGFISELLSGAKVEGRFDVGLEWRGEDGLTIKASGGIEIALPIHRSLGPIDLNTLYIALRILEDGTLSLETSAGLTGNLGPLRASVERIGAKLDLRFTDDADARFGMFDMDLGFKPPSGIGLAIDAGMVKGGGYLYLDSENEEYAGALELIFSDSLELAAIGVITTRMPDGSKGFSLLIIITVDFGTGFQLGYGFVLKAVGGLLGLNRTTRLDALKEGVRTGAVENIMFPTDVVANAPRIISDLRAFFPAARDIFLIGPMAKLDWGTPTLITVSIGVIIEIPGNIAIVGVIKVALPTDDDPLLVLQVNFVGAIEFDKKRLYFFASLFESRVLFIAIEGEMGLLIAWGEDSNFVLSVGGFHPQFTPPPLPFPSPVRISFNILNESWGRIRVMSYFAVTSNSVQFGTRAELYFGFSELKIEGHIAFDALFQFNPFFFIIEISGGVSLKVFGIGLFSISLRFSLEGPTPWRAKGYGKLKLLFLSFKVNFDFTWGEESTTTLPPIEVMPLLVAEFQKLSNWRAIVPAANNLSVALRALPSGAEILVLHPLGSLAVSQRFVPLDIPIDKIGTQRPRDANQFSIGIEGELVKVADVEEPFAIGQYQDLSDADKLKKAFEPITSGCEAAPTGNAFASGSVSQRTIRYETTIIDKGTDGLPVRFAGLLVRLFEVFVRGSAVTTTVFSNKTKKQLQPFDDAVEVVAGGYAVAFNKDNSAYTTTAIFSSQARAEAYLQQQVASDPPLGGSLHVIPEFELKRAA